MLYDCSQAEGEWSELVCACIDNLECHTLNKCRHAQLAQCYGEATQIKHHGACEDKEPECGVTCDENGNWMYEEESGDGSEPNDIIPFCVCDEVAGHCEFISHCQMVRAQVCQNRTMKPVDMKHCMDEDFTSPEPETSESQDYCEYSAV